MNTIPRPGQPEPPPQPPAPPPFDDPKPVREPDPERLPDEDPLPNPDENDAPPLHGRVSAAAPHDKEKDNLTDPEPLPPRKARQGRRGQRILFVLLGGLILAAIVWWLVEIYGGAIAPEDAAGDPATVPLEELQTENPE